MTRNEIFFDKIIFPVEYILKTVSESSSVLFTCCDTVVYLFVCSFSLSRISYLVDYLNVLIDLVVIYSLVTADVCIIMSVLLLFISCLLLPTSIRLTDACK